MRGAAEPPPPEASGPLSAGRSSPGPEPSAQCRLLATQTEGTLNTHQPTLNMMPGLLCGNIERALCMSMCVSYLVVDITVGEHGVEVLHGLTGTPVVVAL